MDFTIEVERSLRVLDGVIVVIDASAGVQAQTATVWRQADRYRLPRMVFMNKLDKPNASFDWALKNISEKLSGTPLLCNIPVLDSNGCPTGFVDVVNLIKYPWGEGIDHDGVALLPEDCTAEIEAAREELVSTLVDYDDTLADIVLSDSFNPLDLSALEISQSIRAACSKHACYPVICGSALKNIGVKHCLDSVCHYLPSPSVENYCGPNGDARNELSAFVFKVFSGFDDSNRKTVSYVRVYSGTLRSGDAFKVANSGKVEKIGQHLYEPMGSELSPVKLIRAGSIGILSGLKYAKNGDTLVSKDGDASVSFGLLSFSKIKLFSDKHATSFSFQVLRSFLVPKPVVYCLVEPESFTQIPKLDKALESLCRPVNTFLLLM